MSEAQSSLLNLIDKIVFKPAGFVLSNIQAEKESREYSAHSFQLNGTCVKFRTAKITPTKTGQFVSIWKRNEHGITAPNHIDDGIGLYLIAVQKEGRSGVFIFPPAVLLQHGILSGNNKEGKRGIRVYPVWDIATNKQAQLTQKWQLAYFVEFGEEYITDKKKAIALLSAI